MMQAGQPKDGKVMMGTIIEWIGCRCVGETSFMNRAMTRDKDDRTLSDSATAAEQHRIRQG